MEARTLLALHEVARTGLHSIATVVQFAKGAHQYFHRWYLRSV